MPSIVPGFEYDIFISYRQKDNKGDHWVTEFVNALKSELDATFKEDISIYFDENLHDGLLEMHDVDDSLKGKLKCLVFVPILSRTYCDSKSFAWDHEFKAFLKTTSEDAVGLKVKLANGNVTSRVLPVKIHELEQADVKLFEAETASILRSIDFVYKTPGVNRPLLPTDQKEDNLTHTLYRDQVNKVANAIREIISSIQNPHEHTATAQRAAAQQGPIIGRSKRKWFAFASLTLLLAAIFFYLFLLRPEKLKDPGSSGVAILPFRNNTGNEELNYYGVGMASEIRTKLSLSKQFSFLSALQATLPYINTMKSPQQIGKELNVDYLLCGVYQQADKKIKVDVELIDVKDGTVVWTLPSENDLINIFDVQSEIAGRVLAKFTSGKLTTANSETPTNNLEAYARYTKGCQLESVSEIVSSVYEEERSAIFQFEEAVRLDSGFAQAWASLIDANGYIYLNEPNDSLKEKLDEYMRYFHSHFEGASLANFVNGSYSYHVQHKYNEALQYLLQFLEENPDNSIANGLVGSIYKRKLDFPKAIEFKRKSLIMDPGNGGTWKDLADILVLMGDYSNALRADLRALSFGRKDRSTNIVVESIMSGRFPEQIPDQLRKEMGEEYLMWKAMMDRDWKQAKIHAGNSKNNYWKALIYQSMGTPDSAKMISLRELKGEGSELSKATFHALAGDKAMSIELVNDYFNNLTRSGDDRMSLCYKLIWEIYVYTTLGEYKLATERLTHLNQEFPEFGDYGQLLYHPVLDNIRKEYPLFQKALSELKIKPMVDVTKMIKF